MTCTSIVSTIEIHDINPVTMEIGTTMPIKYFNT